MTYTVGILLYRWRCSSAFLRASSLLEAETVIITLCLARICASLVMSSTMAFLSRTTWIFQSVDSSAI